MAQPLTLEDGIGRKELVAIQRRFTDLQSQRLQRILEDLLPAQQVFMQVLPLLLHINHPLLPGYVTDETAAGIVDYTPDRETLRAAQRLSRTFRYRRQALKRPLIHALYLIGDNGSLGATRHQGIEVWLCHDATLAEAGLNELERKCERIQEWGRELRLKVEIRMLPVDRVSHHPDSPLAVTSPPLLLEEFYRNGLLLAGLPPLWWLIPPEHEVEYRHYAQMLIARRFVSPQDCLDFGGLEVYSSEELFTAALHRLDEGIDRPYDALLQMLLMERYLRDHPTPSWVSWEMKKAVYAGETGADALDPYLLLYLHLERHLQALGHPHRLELVRRTLYFRSGVCLSRPRNIGWRHRLMRGLTQEWGWDDARLRMLDQRREWKTARVMRERDLLLQELSNAYRLLTSLGRRQADGRTRSTRKLRLLGRKLYARWDQRAGKVDRTNPGISADLHEGQLTLHQEEEGPWQLCRGKLDEPQAADTPPLRSAETLLELLAWCQLNGLVMPETGFTIHSPRGRPTPTELHAMLRILAEEIPGADAKGVSPEDFVAPPVISACTLFVNINHDPAELLAQGDRQLTSNRCDPLSYGSAHTNLVTNLEQLTHNSWGEWLVRRYQGTDGLLDGVCNYLTNLALDVEGTPADVRAHCVSSLKGGVIEQRVAALFNHAARIFRQCANSRYVGEIGDAYYTIQNGGRGYFWLRFDSIEELLDELQQPLEPSAPVVITHPLPDDSLLKTLAKRLSH